MLECNFLHGYLWCLLPGETIDVEVKVTTMKEIHAFRRDCTSQIIMCKPWSPRLCPYLSLAWKMQIYLKLKDPEANHPHSSPNQPDKPNTPSPQKALVPRRPANRKQNRRNRSKQANRRQFKVRLIEKPLFPSNIATPTRSETVTTTATVTQSTRTNPIITSMMWPTAKTTTVPLSIYNVPSARIQEIPNSPVPKPWPKPQGRESTPIPVHKISPMEQQPAASLIHKTTATAKSAILPAMSTPSRSPTPWPNTFPASANLFVTRSWPLPPNKDDSPIPAMQKRKKESDSSKTEITPKKTTIPRLL